MNRLFRSVAYALSVVTAFQPLAAAAATYRYNYTIYGGATNSIPGVDLPPGWEAGETTFGEWTDSGALYSCSNWSPSPSSVGKGLAFIQTATDCKQDQERWSQANTKNDSTGQIEPVGDKVTERRTIRASDNRQAEGILENWSVITPSYTPWIDVNSLYSCSSWTPASSSYTQTSSFTQASASCKTDQARQRQDREQEKYTGEIRNKGSIADESQTLLAQRASRSYSVTLSEWSDTGDKTACTNWSPAQNTIDLDVEFTQTATDCGQKQQRDRAESFVDHKTGKPVILSPTIETRTLTSQISTRKIKGTKIPLAISLSGANSSFSDSPFLLSWTAKGASSYDISANDNASGISTSATSLGMTTSKTVSASGTGSFTYTVTANNELGESLSANKVVAVESPPTFESFLVNSAPAITVSPGAALTFTGAGFSTGSSIQGRNAANTANSTLPSKANTAPGTTNYYAAAAKTLNGVTKNSPVKSVAVTVVSAPAITSFTAPPGSFTGEAATLRWAATDAVSYKIRSNNAASGVSTSDLQANSSEISVIPTAKGTFTYTLTAVNAANVSKTATVTLVVEDSPIISSFTTSAASVAAGGNASLSWITSPATSLSIDQSVGAVTGTSKSINVGSAIGDKTYTLSLSRTVNGVTRTSSKSLTIKVIAAPTTRMVSAPTTNVFATAPFTLSWEGTSVSGYTITGSATASGVTSQNLGTSTTTNITPTAAGSYTYTITGQNSVGVTSSVTKTVVVEALPSITALSANATSLTTGSDLTLTWATSNPGALTIDQGVGTVTGTSKLINVGMTPGTKTYSLSTSKKLNALTKSASKSVTVTIIAAPTVAISSAPSNSVFVSSPFTLAWKGSGATSYTIQGSNSASGVSTNAVSVGAGLSQSITPTSAGTFVYTIVAKNALGATATTTQTVVVEATPTISAMVATPASVAVGGNTTLSWTTSTATSLAIDQGVGVVTGTSKAISVGTTASSKSYTLTLTRTLNGVTKTATKSVSVTTVAAPTVEISTAPSTNVFVSTAFNLGWKGTAVSTYTIKSNNANSGIPIAATALGTATSKAITPTATGTFTYTITATNSVGVSVTTVKSITVEAIPTISSMVAAPTSVTAGGITKLTWTVSGSPTLAIDQGIGSVTGTTISPNVGVTAGNKVYTMTASKVLNGIKKTVSKSASVTVIAAPTVKISSVPANVFTGVAFNIAWVGSGVTSYTITASHANSGISAGGTAMKAATTADITPLAAGTYVYTITAQNSLGATATATATVKVDALPVVSTFTATPASIASGGSVTLAWATSTATALNIDQGVGAVTGTSKAVNVGTTAGAKKYTLTLTRTLNGVTKIATKATSVTIVAAPTVKVTTAPSTNVFINTAFTLGWTGTNATSYTISGNNAASGISTAAVNLNATTSRAITPTAAGTYTYTIIATNSVGVVGSTTHKVTVEALPTLTALTATPSIVETGGSTTLKWTQSNATTMTIDQGVGAVTGTSKSVAVGTTNGSRNYAMTVSKVLNGVTKSASKTVSVTIQKWTATTATYSAWGNTSVAYNCSNWAPSPWAYSGRTQFTQTASNCVVDQSRTRQDRQIEATSKAIRNVGAVVTETQTVGGQSSSRSYLHDFNDWWDVGGYYNCSAWTPDASTVDSGTAFTQTANCTITQNRGAMGYIMTNGSWTPDPAVPYRTESQAIARNVSQAATGTKVVEECPPVSNAYRFFHRSTMQGESYVPVWANQTLPVLRYSKYGHPTITVGGYVYYNNDITMNQMGVAKNYAICRKPI